MKSKQNVDAKPDASPLAVTLLGYLVAVSFFLPLVTEVARYANNRGLWVDELLSLWILRLPFDRFLDAIYSGYDGMLPVFYLITWPVVHLFPGTEFAARWLQVVPALLAPVIFYFLISKRFSPLVAAVSVTPTIWFFAQYMNLAWHLRAYGFMLFATAVAIALLDRSPDRRSWRWVLANAGTQVLLIGSQPFGIFYCGLLGVARWIADWKCHGQIFEKRLVISYVPAALTFVVILPAIQAARKLVEPIPWQPATTYETLTKILFPDIASRWALVALVLFVIPLLLFPSKNPQTHSRFPLFLVLVPLFFLFGTLAVWFYSLQKPLYLDRYFSPNVWAWCLIIAFFAVRLESMASSAGKRVSLILLLMLSLPMAYAVMGSDGKNRTQGIIDATHLLLQGTRDDEILDANYPVLTSDLNVFMERLHYNPRTLDYRTVFSRAIPPLENDRSYTERRISEGLVELGMNGNQLLDPQEAISLAKEKGGVTYLGVKRAPETQEVISSLQKAGFQVDSKQVQIAGSVLYIDSIFRR